MNNNLVGLNISKNVFHLYGQTADTKVVKKKLKRGELLAYIAKPTFAFTSWMSIF